MFIKIFFLLLGLGSILYANTLSYPFVHDEVVHIVQNPEIAGIQNFSSIFFPALSLDQHLLFANPYYRPLIEILYRLEYQLFHFNAFGYHAVNILLHGINSFFIFMIASFLFSRGLALTLAVLFLTHPVQTQAVACISGVSNLMSSFFILASFCLYIYTQRREERQIILFYALALVLFAAGLLAKEQAAILPFLILLFEFCYPNKKEGPRLRLYLRILGFFLVGLAYVIFRKMVLGNFTAPFFIYNWELWLRILAIPQAILTYFGILCFPTGLHYYRVMDINPPNYVPLVVLAAVIFIVFLLARGMDSKKRRMFIFGMGWFFIVQIPTLNIAPLIIEYTKISLAEHFMYLPLAGFLIGVLALFSHYSPAWFKTGSKWGTGILIFIVTVYSVLTLQQNTYWRAEIPLFERTVKFEKDVGRVYILLGKAYYFDKQYQKAIPVFEKALAIMTGYADKAQVKEARSFYLGFIKGIHFDMAHCLEGQQRFIDAVEHYLAALKIDPYDENIHNNVAVAYLNVNNAEAARKHLDQALRLNPNNLMSQKNLTLLNAIQHRKDEGKPQP